MSVLIESWVVQEHHLASLIRLGSSYYPREHPCVSSDYLSWLYLANPAGPARMTVALDDASNDVIGMIAFVPITLDANGRPQEAVFAANVLTHPLHREKNLFVRMIRFSKDMLAGSNVWLVGHPNAAATPGWKRQKMTFREPLVFHLAKFRSPLSTACGRRIRSKAELVDLSDEFWQGLSGGQTVRLRYSADFLAWRFLDAPHRNYSLYAVEQRGKTCGLRVSRRIRGVFDLMVDCAFPSSLPAEAACRVSWPTIMAYPQNGGIAESLANGFWRLPMRRQMPFFVTTWAQEPDNFDMSGITLAASDL